MEVRLFEGGCWNRGIRLHCAVAGKALDKCVMGKQVLKAP